MAKGISCHIGVNRVDLGHYDGWSGPLVACEYDAEDLQDIAGNIGYRTTMLLTQAATRDAVMTNARQAAENLSGGDIFLLTYSGHGGQVPDVNGGERDVEDETSCLYDGELLADVPDADGGLTPDVLRNLNLADYPAVYLESTIGVRGDVYVFSPNYLSYAASSARTRGSGKKHVSVALGFSTMALKQATDPGSIATE